MAQPATNPKIEELRFRLKTDPRSRLFYQLAEELRKGGQFAEAEGVLRSGLEVYPAYLAAWVSLGRVLRELRNDTGAVEALLKAMQLDPGNVVAARLLADAHLALGDRVEAIKKYKLVLALLPGDEELKGTIERLERELHPPAPVPVEEAQRDAAPAAAETAAVLAFDDGPPVSPPAVAEASRLSESNYQESPFDKTIPPFEESTGDAEPMLVAHEESPFQEPVENATLASLDIEQPAGIQIDAAPADDEADVFAPDVAEAAAPATEDVTNTLTMAELYERQGLVHEAQHIYENILARDPENSGVRAKLDAVAPRVNPKIERLERWLAKVARKEVDGV